MFVAGFKKGSRKFIHNIIKNTPRWRRGRVFASHAGDRGSISG